MPYPNPKAEVAIKAIACVDAFSTAKPAPVSRYPMTNGGRYPRHVVSAVASHTPHRDDANCTVKKNPACESSSDHREMNTGKMGPMITVGMPINTNPAKRSARRFLLVATLVEDATVVAMREVILKE